MEILGLIESLYKADYIYHHFGRSVNVNFACTSILGWVYLYLASPSMLGLLALEAEKHF